MLTVIMLTVVHTRLAWNGLPGKTHWIFRNLIVNYIRQKFGNIEPRCCHLNSSLLESFSQNLSTIKLSFKLAVLLAKATVLEAVTAVLLFGLE
jgi:hypothetical protein